MNVPLDTNLREDPFERAPFESDMYRRWAGDKLWTLVPGASHCREVHPVVQGVSTEPEEREHRTSMSSWRPSRLAQPEPASDGFFLEAGY